MCFSYFYFSKYSIDVYIFLLFYHKDMIFSTNILIIL